MSLNISDGKIINGMLYEKSYFLGKSSFFMIDSELNAVELRLPLPPLTMSNNETLYIAVECFNGSVTISNLVIYEWDGTSSLNFDNLNISTMNEGIVSSSYKIKYYSAEGDVVIPQQNFNIQITADAQNELDLPIELKFYAMLGVGGGAIPG